MIKRHFSNFKNWSNSNQGILAIIIAFIGLIPFNKIDLGLANTFIDKLMYFLSYDLTVPSYLLLIIITIGLIYYNIIKRRFKINRISVDFLEGKWKNEWTVNGIVGSEICQIKKDGKYYVNGEHWFTLIDFMYDYKTNKISFNKSGIRPGDNRKMINILTIDNNDLLSGEEDNYKIKYIRL